MPEQTAGRERALRQHCPRTGRRLRPGAQARQAPEAPRQASVRRVYQYLVAGLGLSVTLIGIAGLLILLVDILTSPALVGMDSYHRESVAAFVAMILVGTPVWWLPWRWVQNRA